ncbi:MOSC domain-containing protein [Glycomyces sp. L485]|uniref:MOSC domain-containing protein n=1 Tax=Glycomyces sp. L485 TaxID=2909235 RepID=UPI001F4B0F52|nr:MOSC domain-containing protein [Glycomyces sp. L485]
MSVFAGTIDQMWRYPVKGLRGEAVRSAEIGFHGMAGDRNLGLFKPGTGDKLWGGSHPRMMAWEAAWPAQCGCADGTGDAPVVYEPSGAAWSADDAGLPAALADDLGAEVEVRRVERVYGRILVVFESSLKRLSEQLGREIEAARFRPNVIVSADLEPFAEVELEPGTAIRLGEGDFTVQKPCERCVLPSWDPVGRAERDMELHRHIIKTLGNHFGIYLRTSQTATIKAGDPISG